ncbi:MAG: ParA family protein, partial [Oscillospiraceae bacterium]|nr:ParA family protein [Oscillospiraceae bacterium]
MIKISIYNNTGGVGKTTTCINLADKFSKAYPVIVIDCDGQNNSLNFFTADLPPNTTNHYETEIYPTHYNNIYNTRNIEPQLADIKETITLKIPDFG